MKLIKLSTNNKFTHFDSNFDTDIIINENSSIALKNLVFEPKYHNFTASGQTGEMTINGFSSDLANDYTKVTLFPQTYRSTEFFGLTQNITNALNRSLYIKHYSNVTKESDKQLCSQFACYVAEETQRVVIEYRLSPLINCFGDSLIQGEGPFMVRSLDKLLFESDGDIGEDNICSVATSNPAVDTQEYRLTTPLGTGLCKGNGIFYVQIKNSGIVADPLKNGFSIGLSFYDIMANTTTTPDLGVNPITIPDTARNIEISFRDGNSNYFIRKSSKNIASVEVDSGVAPGRHASGTDMSNDILMIKVTNNASGQKVITGSVAQYTGTEHLLFTHILSEEEQTPLIISGDNKVSTGITSFNPTVFQPYIFYRGNGSTIKTHNARMTFDPYIKPVQFGGDESKYTDDPNDYNNTFLPAFDYQTEYNALENGLKTNIPFFDSPQRFDETSHFTKLVLPLRLASLLGFTSARIDKTMSVEVKIQRMSKYMAPSGNGIIGHFIQGSIFNFLEDPLFEHSDFFLVESQSLQLDSFNSSPDGQPNILNQVVDSTNGTRKSILDTIPVSDINGIIQHEPNELIFIDIKNTQKINIRNLKFRILTKDFDEIETMGESHLTLLIKD